MNKKLDGKVAVVTGGSSGIGLATTKAFVREGAYVFMTGRREAELAGAVKEVGQNVTGVPGDISKMKDLDRLFSEIKREKGKLDILFANAGSGNFAKLGEISESQFDKEFGTNVKGTFFTVQKALPLMKPGSSIVLTASIAGKKGMENFSVYSATKAAIRSFARTWTTDLKARGIRVNAVSPGVVVTPAYDTLLGKERTKDFTDYMKGQIPLGRVGLEDEIASAVVFLASDEASYITGVDLCVDGGLAQV
jgi:NAD(P)-dependent dehydrogenase (short-subunit alcohol dehydrogenase family)